MARRPSRADAHPAFEEILAFTQKAEGGIVTAEEAAERGDPGGETRYGYSWRAASDHGLTLEEFRALTPEDVADVFHDRYWVPINGNAIAEEDPSIAAATFDWAIQSGPGLSVKTLQTLLGAATDGVVGEDTLERLRDADAEELFGRYVGARDQFLKSWIEANPAKRMKNARGFINRLDNLTAFGSELRQPRPTQVAGELPGIGRLTERQAQPGDKLQVRAEELGPTVPGRLFENAAPDRGTVTAPESAWSRGRRHSKMLGTGEGWPETTGGPNRWERIKAGHQERLHRYDDRIREDARRYGVELGEDDPTDLGGAAMKGMYDAVGIARNTLASGLRRVGQFVTDVGKENLSIMGQDAGGQFARGVVLALELGATLVEHPEGTGWQALDAATGFAGVPIEGLGKIVGRPTSQFHRFTRRWLTGDDIKLERDLLPEQVLRPADYMEQLKNLSDAEVDKIVGEHAYRMKELYDVELRPHELAMMRGAVREGGLVGVKTTDAAMMGIEKFGRPGMLDTVPEGAEGLTWAQLLSLPLVDSTGEPTVAGKFFDKLAKSGAGGQTRALSGGEQMIVDGNDLATVSDEMLGALQARLGRFYIAPESAQYRGPGGQPLRDVGTGYGYYDPARVLGYQGVSTPASRRPLTPLTSATVDEAGQRAVYRTPEQTAVWVRQGMEPWQTRETAAHEITHGLFGIRDPAASAETLKRVIGEEGWNEILEELLPHTVRSRGAFAESMGFAGMADSYVEMVAQAEAREVAKGTAGWISNFHGKNGRLPTTTEVAEYTAKAARPSARAVRDRIMQDGTDYQKYLVGDDELLAQAGAFALTNANYVRMNMPKFGKVLEGLSKDPAFARVVIFKNMSTIMDAPDIAPEIKALAPFILAGLAIGAGIGVSDLFQDET